MEIVGVLVWVVSRDRNVRNELSTNNHSLCMTPLSDPKCLGAPVLGVLKASKKQVKILLCTTQQLTSEGTH